MDQKNIGKQRKGNLRQQLKYDYNVECYTQVSFSLN